MKKILYAAMAAVMTLSLSVTAMAANSSITVKNNVSSSKPVSYTYDSATEGEIVKSIKSLMTNLGNVTATSSAVQTLTISSISADNKPVSVTLRLSLPNKSEYTEDDYSALDYYNIKITDAKGAYYYDYEREKNTGGGERTTFKDIPLHVFNTKDATESRLMNVTVSANPDKNKSGIISAAKRLDWSIVSDTSGVEVNAEETPLPEEDDPSQTAGAAPAANDNPSETPTAAPATASPKTKSDKNGNVSLPKGEYEVGRDFEAGRYAMTGTGKVHVYTDNGELKSTVMLKAENDKSSNGIAEYVISLADGEKMVVDENAELTPYTAPTATPKPTSTPKASTSSTGSGTTSSGSAQSSKTNPKTGDNMPLVSISAIGLLALAGATAIFIKRRKEN